MNSSEIFDALIENDKKKCFNAPKRRFPKNLLFCDVIYEEFMCWTRTPANATAQQSCVNDFVASKRNETNIFATKKCFKNGTWLPTNFSECGEMYKYLYLNGSEEDIIEEQHFYKLWISLITYVASVGYVISILAASLALLILIFIKRLHCARNKLHIHLFISTIMRGCMYLLKNISFVEGTALTKDTNYVNDVPIFSKKEYSWICKAIYTLQNYFIITNYTFILMEGMYLHNLIFFNLFSQKNRVQFYYITGWGLPLMFIIPWAILKYLQENILCWTKNVNEHIGLLIDTPIAFTVAVNFLLFLNIVRVLFRKINSAYIQQRKRKYSKLLKSTLTLIFFFGVPYSISLIVKLYVKENKIIEVLWLLCDQTFSALQGLIAALVYCLYNSDVQTEIKRKYHSFRERSNKEFRRSRTISHTQQISLNNLEEQQENGISSKKISECYF